MNKHKLRTERKRKDILLATVEIIGTTPLSQVTINKIKTKAKVSPMTIYNIFSSKYNLIHEAILKITVDKVTLVIESLNSNKSSTERFKDYITIAFKTALIYPQQKNLRDYITESFDDVFVKAVTDYYKLTYPALKTLFNDMINDGLINEQIDFNRFITILDMITKIDPIYYSDEESFNIMLNGFINFFK